MAENTNPEGISPVPSPNPVKDPKATLMKKTVHPKILEAYIAQRDELAKTPVKAEKPVVREVQKDGKIIPFEAYFEIVKNRNSAVQAHHFEAMKSFAVKNLGRSLATEDEFDLLFKNY